MKSAFTHAAVIGLYGLCILPAKMVGLLLGRDPLRLRRPAGRESYWLPKAPPGGMESYFSQGAKAAARAAGVDSGPRGTVRLVLPLYYALARLVAPKRRGPVETGTSAAQRDKGIPDEVYTLW